VRKNNYQSRRGLAVAKERNLYKSLFSKDEVNRKVAKREIICIGCPVGCPLEVEVENGVVTKVTGNTCKRGETYAEKECTNPTRIVTSTVVVEGGLEAVVPVKTERDVPKGKIFECMRALKSVSVKAPVHIGDVIVKDIVGTGVDIVATKEVPKI
jgi:CxxC motif-containing protein